MVEGVFVPPSVVKNIRDLIFWQYAKIIAESAGFGKKNYAFVMTKFKQLQEGEIFWNEIREYVKEREKKDECIFCGVKTNLTIDHMMPRCFDGPDDEKNVIWVCKECNSSKGGKRLYEFWTIKKGLKGAKYEVPRIAEGKYLKLVYEVLNDNSLLDADTDKIRGQICPQCDLKKHCIREKSEGKLSPLCLDGILTLCFQTSS
jgi:hypothetical protein